MSDEATAEYLRQMRGCDAAVSEGFCPICSARLAPEERRDGVSSAGRCSEHGLFEIEGDEMHHTIELVATVPDVFIRYSAGPGQADQ